jgi:hypothetical protein
MIDKRFWAGAVLAVTVVVAGAGSLPALLLRPVATDPPPVALAPAAKVAEPVQVQADAEPAKPSPPPPPQSVAAPPPAPAPVREAVPAFPPVQPVGITTPAQPVATPPRDTATVRAAVAAPETTIRPQRTAGQAAARQKRKLVRPAPYPMREFFAWRR